MMTTSLKENIVWGKVGNTWHPAYVVPSHLFTNDMHKTITSLVREKVSTSTWNSEGFRPVVLKAIGDDRGEYFVIDQAENFHANPTHEDQKRMIEESIKSLGLTCSRTIQLDYQKRVKPIINKLHL